MIAKNFDAIDTKKAGAATLDDVKAWIAVRRAANWGAGAPAGAPAPAGK